MDDEPPELIPGVPVTDEYLELKEAVTAIMLVGLSLEQDRSRWNATGVAHKEQVAASARHVVEYFSQTIWLALRNCESVCRNVVSEEQYVKIMTTDVSKACDSPE